MVDFDDAIALARRTYWALARAHHMSELAAVMDQAKDFLDRAGVPVEDDFSDVEPPAPPHGGVIDDPWGLSHLG